MVKHGKHNSAESRQDQARQMAKKNQGKSEQSTQGEGSAGIKGADEVIAGAKDRATTQCRGKCCNIPDGAIKKTSNVLFCFQ